MEKDLNWEEKIGQMFLIAMNTDHVVEKVEDLILKNKIGGVLLYRKNFKNYEEMIKLINYIKTLNNRVNSIPILIGIDQEGGRVNRMPDEFKNFPSNSRLAQVKNQEIVKKTGELMGDLLQKNGINLNFAPVLDIKRFEDSHAIGDRAFSNQKETVSELGILLMKELQKKDIISVIKHFPGHGATKQDSHLFLPKIRKLELLEKEDLYPFQKAIQEGADAILVSHLRIPKLTKGYPTTMSKEFIQTYIRKTIGFQGLIITDDMRMNGIRKLYGKNRPVEKAFLAGNDIIVMKYVPDDSIIQKILEKVKKEKELQKQVNKSVTRILAMKEKYHITDQEVKKDFQIEKWNQEVEKIRKECHLLSE